MQDETELYQELDRYYKSNPEKLELIKAITNGDTHWSLREIEKTINYTDGLYVFYRQQILNYGREYFDPFRRKHRFDYNGVDTSIGQLNFFKWVFENDIIHFH